MRWVALIPNEQPDPWKSGWHFWWVVVFKQCGQEAYQILHQGHLMRCQRSFPSAGSMLISQCGYWWHQHCNHQEHWDKCFRGESWHYRSDSWFHSSLWPVAAWLKRCLHLLEPYSFWGPRWLLGSDTVVHTYNSRGGQTLNSYWEAEAGG